MRKASPVFLAAALLAQPAPAFAEDGVVLDDQGIKATGLDGEVSLHVGGKLHLDAVAVDDGAGGYDDAGVRRARLNLRLDYRDVLTLRAEREFAGSKGWRNLYAQLRPARGAVIQAGQFNVPFSLEDLQSTNVIPFPERSLAAALTSEFGVGVMGGYGARRFTVRAGWFGDALDTPAGPAPSLGRGLVGRATVLAVDSGPAKLHLGLGLERRSFRAGEAVRYSADAGSSLGPRILRTPELGNLAHRTGYNAEIAFLRRKMAAIGLR